MGPKFRTPLGRFVVKSFAEERGMRKGGIFLLSWGLLMAFFSLAIGAEPVKIAYVDMQKALNLCEAGREAKKQITVEVEKMQKTFAGKQREVEKLREDLEKRGSVLNETVRRDKERDYQTKLRDLQRLQKDYEDELRRRDRELTDNILKNLEAIVKKLGEEGKYTLILERNQPAIIYISSGLDLTEEVIKISDQKPK
jgi:outer membrane protein